MLLQEECPLTSETKQLSRVTFAECMCDAIRMLNVKLVQFSTSLRLDCVIISPTKRTIYQHRDVFNKIDLISVLLHLPKM